MLGSVFLAILSAFYLGQIPGRDDMEALSTDLRAEFEGVFAPDHPIEIKLVPAPRKGQRMSLRIRCTLREKLPLPTSKAHRGVLQQIGQRALLHPSWVGKVEFASVENEGVPKLAAKVLPQPVERTPFDARRADRTPRKG